VSPQVVQLRLETIGANVQSKMIGRMALRAFSDAVITKNDDAFSVPPGREPRDPKFVKN
jgi:hypothetical protein